MFQESRYSAEKSKEKEVVRRQCNIKEKCKILSSNATVHLVNVFGEMWAQLVTCEF